MSKRETVIKIREKETVKPIDEDERNRGRDILDLTYVSRVRFNRERAKAIVYVRHIPNPLMGISYYVGLQKKDGKWDLVLAIPEVRY